MNSIETERLTKRFRLLNSYRDLLLYPWQRSTKLAVDDPSKAGADLVPGVRVVASYVGNGRCVECHKTAGAVWAKSGHAEAFDTLVAKQPRKCYLIDSLSLALRHRPSFYPVFGP